MPTFQKRHLKLKGPVSDIAFKTDQRQLPAKHLATTHHIIVQICTDVSGVACLFEERVIQYNSVFMIHAVYVYTYLMIFEAVRN